MLYHLFEEGRIDNKGCLLEKGKLIIIVFYMDDHLIIGNHGEKIRQLKDQFFSKFEMTKFELLKFFLGVEFLFIPTCIFMCHIPPSQAFQMNFTCLNVILHLEPFQRLLNLTKMMEGRVFVRPSIITSLASSYISSTFNRILHM